ncbi:MAG: CPBP family intramembrane glutamic endopeptidase [Dehalococcoidia bacterium]
MSVPLARGTVLADESAAPARAWVVPVAFAAALVLYSNLLYALPGDLSFPPDPILFGRALLVPALAVVWAVRTQGLSLTDLGITTRNFWPSAAIGLAAAVAITVPAVLFFLFPVGVGDIEYETFADDSVPEFAFWAAVRYPLSAAVFEEVLFRGVLLALGLRAFGVRGAVAFTALTFGAWHICVDYATMSESSVADDDLLFAIAQAGAMVALIVGGAALAWMRLRSGSLAGPIVFHWLAVVAFNSTLFAQT